MAYKQYYISELMKYWGFNTIPFKTYNNLLTWTVSELSTELHKQKEKHGRERNNNC